MSSVMDAKSGAGAAARAMAREETFLPLIGPLVGIYPTARVLCLIHECTPLEIHKIPEVGHGIPRSSHGLSTGDVPESWRCPS